MAFMTFDSRGFQIAGRKYINLRTAFRVAGAGEIKYES